MKGIKNYIQKLIDDTLKTPSGKWSRTSLTMFFSFVFANSYLGYELIYNDKFYIEAFYALLATATSMKWLGDIDAHKTKELT